MAVNRTKLRVLPGDTLAALAQSDELEGLYMHLVSMRNFSSVKDRLHGVRKDQRAESAPAAAREA